MSSLDIKAVREKFNSLSNKTRTSDIIWKPIDGTNHIRIVPLATEPSYPFIEASFYYFGNRTYLSPSTFGEADPILDFCLKLREGGNLEREAWNETKKFFPKTRTFVPIVVRGKEAEGVKFWGFGKTVYKELLSIMGDPDYGDITDPHAGRDIKIEFTPKDKSDTDFPKTAVRASPRQTPITADKELLNKILTVQPNLFDAWEKHSYDELKEVLEKFLSPAVEQERSTTSADNWDNATEPGESPSIVAKESAKEPLKKSASEIDKEFDDVFNS